MFLYSTVTANLLGERSARTWSGAAPKNTHMNRVSTAVISSVMRHYKLQMLCQTLRMGTMATRWTHTEALAQGDPNTPACADGAPGLMFLRSSSPTKASEDNSDSCMLHDRHISIYTCNPQVCDGWPLLIFFFVHMSALLILQQDKKNQKKKRLKHVPLQVFQVLWHVENKAKETSLKVRSVC